MVQAWYMDSSDGDQKLPHQLDPPQPVSLEHLEKLGVLYFCVPADEGENGAEISKIRTERGYSYKDQIECSREKLENYDAKLKMFYEEHLHSDDEIRFVLDGSGYFDVRDKEDKWIRIYVEKNDLIIVPAGIYHRFTLDTKNYIKVLRLFVGEPIWTPYNRPSDDHTARKDYLSQFGTAA